MRSIIFILTLAVASVSTYHFREQKSNEVPDYDAYVFSLQWGSTYCKTKGNICWEKLKPVPLHKLSIHGLWPGMKGGRQIATCNSGEEIPIVDTQDDLFIEMNKYWVSLVNSNEYFWTHEYNKHGYCYSNKIGDFDYSVYFQKAMDLFNESKYMDIITDAFGEQEEGTELEINYSDFVEKLQERIGGNYFSITCSKINSKQYWNELRLSYDLDFNLYDTSIGTSCSKKKPVYLYYHSNN